MDNLWNDGRFGGIADIVCWVIFGVTAVIVSLRIYCRLRTGTKFFGALGLDDLATVFCLMIILAECVLITIAARWGLGKHFDSLSPVQQVQAMKYNAIIDAVIIWGFSTPKFAIIFLLKRLLDHGIKTTIFFWTLALIGQITILVTSIWVFKQCDPVDYQWQQYSGESDVTGTCAPVSILTGIGYFGSSYSAFLDVFFALYPVPFIMKLRMPVRVRITISACLSLGAVASIISIYKLTIMGAAFAIMGDDPTFPIPYLNTLGLSEACILIVCGSLPALGPLFRAASRKMTGDRRSASNSHRTYFTEDSHGSQTRNRWTRINDKNNVGHETVINGAAASHDHIPLVYMRMEEADEQGVR
ncbi:hypothetical protein BX600DRAFT_436467 [Xylariales sp. PMI_506]|nr:hypothetical protein BX600DRAFT_436467 [Xylariales sp. PMI_506]